MSDGEAVYEDDTGAFLGWYFETDDGGAVVVDENDTIVRAVDAHGQRVDEHYAGQQLDTGDDPYDARLSALEEQMAAPQPPPFDYQQARQQASDDAWQARVLRDMENAESQAGKRFSDREAWKFMEDHKADHDAGVEPDWFKSAMAADIANGTGHDARMARAMDHVHDSLRREAGEAYDPAPQPSQETYDLSDRMDRAMLSLDRSNGVDVEGRVYDSSDYDEDIA